MDPISAIVLAGLAVLGVVAWRRERAPTGQGNVNLAPSGGTSQHQLARPVAGAPSTPTPGYVPMRPDNGGGDVGQWISLATGLIATAPSLVEKTTTAIGNINASLGGDSYQPDGGAPSYADSGLGSEQYYYF